MPRKIKPVAQKTLHRNHLRRLHTLRLYSFSALAAMLVLIQLAAHVPAFVSNQHQVLAYATGVSVDGLLSGTNQARAANGLGGLALNTKLTNGAQAKANDMIAKNYWSHTAPDGTQPWAFFTDAGYSYTRAGENLAYGFDTSAQIIDGWMNSAGHRANVLGSYHDVGFGIASGPNYQGGENTVVVAFYGEPAFTPAPASPTQPKPSVPKKTSTAVPQATAAPVPVATTSPTPAPEPTQQKLNIEPTNIVAQPKKITNLDLALGGKANWAMYASLGAVGVTSVGFATTHWQLVRRGWKQSRHFILLHPALDTAVLAAVAGVILTSTAGFIK